MRVYLDNCCYNRPFDDQGQLKIRLETAALGNVDAERFVMLMNRDAGDYTEWRHKHLYQNDDLQSLAAKARKTGSMQRKMRGITIA